MKPHRNLVSCSEATKTWGWASKKHATRRILSLKTGQMSYEERLLALDMLPLAYDREIKDLVLFYKASTTILI